MAPISRISELATMISTVTAKLDTYHTEHGLPTPSFGPDAPPKYHYPAEIGKARQDLLEATDELHALVAGPTDAWVEPLHTALIARQAVYRFKLANSFPKDRQEATYDELATACGLSEPDVRRLIRFAMTYRIFQETEEGTVTHTAASKLFANSPGLQQWVGMVTEELWPAATRVVDALAKWPGSQEPNQAGYNLAHETEEPIFAFLADKPDRAKRFADAMSLFNTGDGYEPMHLLENYPWASLGKTTLVDVGGSLGSVAISIAERFPDITCIVQDRPEVVHAAKTPPDLKDRVTFQAHDFFTEQPVKGADVYYFRWIFHDWADKYAAQILRALVPALKDGARIVISEYLVPEPGKIPKMMERDVRAFDMAMWELQNAKEREVQDWVALLRQADHRFKFVGVTQPPLSKLGIIEARWEE